MAVDLSDIFDGCGGETEGVYGPFEIFIPLGSAKRTAFPQSRLIDLDDWDAGFFKIRDFIAESEAKLFGLDGLRDIVSRETPTKDSDRTSQHSLHYTD
jgi:hypothetical protein